MIGLLSRRTSWLGLGKEGWSGRRLGGGAIGRMRTESWRMYDYGKKVSIGAGGPVDGRHSSPSFMWI